MGSFLNLLLSGGLGGITNLISTIFGSKANRESNAHDESMASHAQFAAEFRISDRGFLDRVIDFLNRLPRPAIVGMVIYYFVLAVNNPVDFQIVNVSLEGVPSSMWEIAFMIIGFFFVARELQRGRDKKLAMSERDFSIQLARLSQLNGMKKMENLGTAKSEFTDVKIGL